MIPVCSPLVNNNAWYVLVCKQMWDMSAVIKKKKWVTATWNYWTWQIEIVLQTSELEMEFTLTYKELSKIMSFRYVHVSEDIRDWKITSDGETGPHFLPLSYSTNFPLEDPRTPQSARVHSRPLLDMKGSGVRCSGVNTARTRNKVYARRLGYVWGEHGMTPRVRSKPPTD